MPVWIGLLVLLSFLPDSSFAKNCGQAFKRPSINAPKSAPKSPEDIQHLKSFEEAEAYLWKFAPRGSGWYESYIEVDGRMSALHTEVARQLGGVAIIGGSEIVDIVLGVGRSSFGEEVNVLHPASRSLKTGMRSHKSPELAKNESLAYYEIDLRHDSRNEERELRRKLREEKRRRKELIAGILPRARSEWISLNDHGYPNLEVRTGPGRGGRVKVISFGEMETEFRIYARNYRAGKSVSAGTYSLWSPLKPRYVVMVNQRGEGRIYFRNEEAFKDYENGILRLPEEHLLKSDPIRSDIELHSLHAIVVYNLYVMTKGRREGWEYSERSLEMLKRWVGRVNQNPLAENYYWNFEHRIVEMLGQLGVKELVQSLREVGYRIRYLREDLPGSLRGRRP